MCRGTGNLMNMLSVRITDIKWVSKRKTKSLKLTSRGQRWGAQMLHCSARTLSGKLSRLLALVGEEGEEWWKHWTKGFPLLITQSITSSSIDDQMSLKILNLSFCWWAFLSQLANSFKPLSSSVHRQLPTAKGTLTHDNVDFGLNLELNNYPELFWKVACHSTALTNQKKPQGN